MKYEGNDNYGHPKQEYLDKLKEMDNIQLRGACDHMIWLSAYANNNPRSDFHWKCDACYDECVRREKVFIYDQAHKSIVASI